LNRHFRFDESETLTVAQSLETFTIQNAWFSFDEDKLGSIEEGKLPAKLYDK